MGSQYDSNMTTIGHKYDSNMTEIPQGSITRKRSVINAFIYALIMRDPTPHDDHIIDVSHRRCCCCCCCWCCHLWAAPQQPDQQFADSWPERHDSNCIASISRNHHDHFHQFVYRWLSLFHYLFPMFGNGGARMDTFRRPPRNPRDKFLPSDNRKRRRRRRSGIIVDGVSSGGNWIDCKKIIYLKKKRRSQISIHSVFRSRLPNWKIFKWNRNHRRITISVSIRIFSFSLSLSFNHSMIYYFFSFLWLWEGEWVGWGGWVDQMALNWLLFSKQKPGVQVRNVNAEAFGKYPSGISSSSSSSSSSFPPPPISSSYSNWPGMYSFDSCGIW